MPRRTLQVEQGQDSFELREGLRAIEGELEVNEDFSPDVQAAAEQAAVNPVLPDLDRTDISFVTIDPPGSMDLDQALHLERTPGGYRVHYAIADVATFVEPGGPLDIEAHRRGQTLYAPDHRIALHPPELSEGAASLLPNQLRPALLWSLDLDDGGESTKVTVERARVRSRARLDYAGAQAEIDSGTADESLLLLREVGKLRLERERDRGGVNLQLPEQEVVVGKDGWSLQYRQLLPVEEWNAQISLLTGMAAAQIMLYGDVGVIRTLPAPPSFAVSRLRRTAAALRLHWPAEWTYADFIRSLDPNTPAAAAMLTACTSLLRGAGYVAFDGGVPEHVEHAAIAAEYAHVTAPLRRLVDRYAGEIAVALCADRDVPGWVRSGLRDLPKAMEESDRRAHQFERAILDLVEAGMLRHDVGRTFEGVITDMDEKESSQGSVMLHDPAVEAPVEAKSGSLPLGQEVHVKLVEADLTQRRVLFELA